MRERHDKVVELLYRLEATKGDAQTIEVDLMSAERVREQPPINVVDVVESKGTMADLVITEYTTHLVAPNAWRIPERCNIVGSAVCRSFQH